MFDCGSFFAKYLLCGFNFVIFVIGGLVLGVGIWLYFDENFFIGLLENLIQAAQTDAAKIVWSNFPNNQEKTKETVYTCAQNSEKVAPICKTESGMYFCEDHRCDKLFQPQLLEIIAYVLIAVGGFTFLTSFVGYCGALIQSQWMLTTYGLLLLVILVIEIIIGALGFIYKGQLVDTTKEMLKKTLQDYVPIISEDTSNASATTLAWDAIQHEFHCCGLDNYTDFSKNPYLIDHNLTIPGSCCKNINYSDISILNCTRNPTEENSYYAKGCFQEIVDKLQGPLNVLIIVAISVAAVEILGIFLSFCLAKLTNNREKR